MKKHKNITRMDYKDSFTFGWWVRVKHKGVTRSKFFSDGRNGGKRKALKAAKDYLDQAEKEVRGA